ncbi:MAG TPA: hypothetical protein VF502_00120 [Stellaceae bacterium]
MPVALVSLMLVWSSEPPPVDVNAPHVAAAADSGCLSVVPGRIDERNGLATNGRNPATCVTSSLPLVRQTMLGSGNVFGDLELSNLDIGQVTSREVKLKFGLRRDLVAGLNATLDGAVGRLLGSITPMFEEQLHGSVIRPLDGHWETGLEGRVAALGSVGLTQLTERTGLIFVRSRYSLVTNRGDEHRVVLKLSADTWQGTNQGTLRHARADLRYEYRRDGNVLSVGLNATDTEPSPIAANASFRIDLRASRKF